MVRTPFLRSLVASLGGSPTAVIEAMPSATSVSMSSVKCQAPDAGAYPSARSVASQPDALPDRRSEGVSTRVGSRWSNMTSSTSST